MVTRTVLPPAVAAPLLLTVVLETVSSFFLFGYLFLLRVLVLFFGFFPLSLVQHGGLDTELLSQNLASTNRVVCRFRRTRK